MCCDWLGVAKSSVMWQHMRPQLQLFHDALTRVSGLRVDSRSRRRRLSFPPCCRQCSNHLHRRSFSHQLVDAYDLMCIEILRLLPLI